MSEIPQSTILNNGVQMPLIGYGSYRVTPEMCERCIIDAVNTGYRLIDTAQYYANEEGIGVGIKHCGIDRNELFITTKLWFRSYETEAAKTAFFMSLRKLQLDYLDLVLLHWPYGNTYAAWRVLEELYKKGTIRAIGVSNYSPSQLLDLMEFNEIVPAVNQVETHLFVQQRELSDFMRTYGITHQAYAPLGHNRANEMFELPIVVKIAEKHGRTPYQIALRFLVQRHISIIPKTAHIERMRENREIFDFCLTDEEMKTLESLDTVHPIIGDSQSLKQTQCAFHWGTEKRYD